MAMASTSSVSCSSAYRLWLVIVPTAIRVPRPGTTAVALLAAPVAATRRRVLRRRRWAIWSEVSNGCSARNRSTWARTAGSRARRAEARALRTGRSWAGRESRSTSVQRSLEGVGKPVEDLLPKQLSIPALAAAAEDCRACDLHERATQTVFGEGSARATVMLVGEQPGDREDVEGRPFVGPAGRFLDGALEAAGIDRNKVYVTNVVKHFKWVPRGKRRIHQSPNRAEVGACRPWLQAEIKVVGPKVIVLL